MKIFSQHEVSGRGVMADRSGTGMLLSRGAGFSKANDACESGVALRLPPHSTTLSRSAQGFALFEIILALALFSLVAVSMTRAVEEIAKASTSARQEAQVLRVLESVLAEVAHQPEFKATSISFNPTADHIDASATIEKVKLINKDKVELDHMFRIRAEAWINDGRTRRMKRSMETYVYSPHSPI